VLKKGQEIDAIITSIDAENRRLSLSIKDLEPNAWDRFVNDHKPGDIVRGKIARFANFGAFVELDDNLEGLCHISELSEDRVEKPEDVVQLGQEMEFKILRIDAENKKIGLSARAVGKDEPIVDTKVYSSQAGSGMASLGELADFGLGKPEPESSPEAEAKSGAEAESKSEPETMAQSDQTPVREAGTQSVTEPDTAPEPVTEPEPIAEAAEANTAPQADGESETEPDQESK